MSRTHAEAPARRNHRAPGPAEEPRAPWIRTPAFERWLNHVATFLVGVSGLVYAWMKYLMEADPMAFSVVNHPWQPFFLHAHVLAAPLAVLALGMIVREHIVRRLTNRRWRAGRMTGLWLTVLILPMVASGYLLQTSSGETTRGVLVAVHLISSGVYLLLYLGHLILTRRGRVLGRLKNGAAARPDDDPREGSALDVGDRAGRIPGRPERTEP